MRKALKAVFAVAIAAMHIGATGTTYLIIPGVRIGPVTRASTEESLLRSMGKAAIKAEVGFGEGFMVQG